MTDPQIRAARRSDLPTVLRFIRELAEYGGSETEVTATLSGLQKTLFDESATAHALICENEDTPIGFAVYFYNFSTWQAQDGLYLEDLYITPEHRGTGAGTAILRYLANLALQNDCGRFEWNVHTTNSPAINFYDRIGAKPKPEWLGYRLTGNDLTQFADSPAESPEA